MTRLTASQAIKAILVIQIGIAAILFGRDIARTLPQISFAPDAPLLDEPINPGDQTRRYDPERLPTRPARPGTDLPPSGDLPARLQFEPDTTEEDVLHISGTIAPGDSERFDDWIETTSREITRVTLDSPGGSVNDSLEIGRALRALGVATEVEAGDICLSACPYLLAAGLDRRAGDDAYIGVHQHYFDENTVLPAFLAVEDIQRGQGEVLEYLLEMDIDPSIMRHALVTPPEEIYILVPEELQEYRLVTQDPENS
ncbi:hypothetical protein [Pseudoruegeria sp. HB172150]|uniref:COG3904 family protein n=1 Tax=Pseudoruegeria sp. HB172150 TaxID=2721164 RepID=UPI001551B86D|nr:hypothetical protein [Pseudoruegeria sp. HB172150]